MIRSELLLDSTLRLDEVGWEEASSIAELLLIHVLNIKRYQLLLHPKLPIKDSDLDTFEELLDRMIKGEPLEYVTGLTEFYGIEMEIRPGVLIPRPETELMIDHAKRISGDGVRMAMDIGCGSGAITLALFEQRIAHEIVAVDVSEEAIRNTAANAAHQGFFRADPEREKLAADLPDNVALLQRTSLNPITKREHRDHLWLIQDDAFSVTFKPPIHPFPLILSNPPYVATHEWHDLPRHIRDHEPKVALEAGDDGLDVHRNLARRLKNWLSPGGAFVGEIGSGQGKAAVALHSQWAKRTELHRDYADLDRFVIAYN